MTLTNPMKVILALVIIVLIGLGFWLLDWQKKQNEIAQLDKKLQERQDKLRQSKELVKALPKLTKEKEVLEKQLNAVLTTDLPKEKPEVFVANFIRDIESLVLTERQRTGDRSFEILSVTPGAMTSQAAPGTEGGDEMETPESLKQFPTRMFQMSMRGRYITLIDFLYQLGALQLERLVTINKIALAPAGKTEGGGRPVLSITIPITAYLRQ